jgi:intracellular multiplication protein IcmD
MKKVTLAFLSLACMTVGTVAMAAATNTTGSGIGAVAATATSNLKAIAQLITAASYVAGMAFAVGAIVKFKAHKDNPSQIPIGTPIALLFVGAALIFAPSVFNVAGSTLFGTGKVAGGVSGIYSLGIK